MKIEFKPADYFARSLKYWWIIVLFMIGGAIAGYVVHLFFPPIYESRAEITTSINFIQTGVLTEEQQDQAIDAVGDIIRSTEVQNAVLNELKNQNSPLESLKELQSISFLERQEYRWRLRIRMKDAQSTATIANIWAEQALNQLLDASSHGVTANGLAEYMSNLENCFKNSTILLPVYTSCSSQNSLSLPEELTRVGSLLQSEKLLSKGIIPEMVFFISQQAQTPVRVIGYNRNLLVFGSSILGFIFGVIFLQFLKFNDH